MKETKHIEHIDYNWIIKKIDGHGGVFSYNNSNSRVVIHGICNKNFIQIFFYNIVLYIKYLIRIFKHRKST